jgi:hypothetical protein
MATTTSRRDFLSRKLVTPASASTDYLGRATTSTVDYSGRSLFATVRANTTAYTLGQQVEFAAGTLYVCTVAGTSAGSEPSVPANGATVVDGGTLTWLRLQ